MATAIATEKTGSAPKTERNVGRVVQVIGPVLDVEFEPEKLPEIYNALRLDSGDIHVTAEVQQHIGQNQVRAVAIGAGLGIRES
jgi:F-type H+-transporting ATPase subunit beta